ncbi:AcrR family transcriptional regulator [Nocardia transvalensis]|uniref:AcrR family transcriptional regulator n=1 Tax=Nocardia transvalensis TaxID=37333 RepID=A0A7W9UIV6_9NOCA|nr:TetR family transcriptional regulator [Nocardia transvalensis]MBB5914779.1 AcrR family transcriptional regulator [Nocardia transvalensis]
MSAESKAPPARAHGGASPRMGLRERKKERTRHTIRTEAFRLFREQGYNETTVEQIAEAAEVSPSTFFRYFPSKDELVLADDLDPLMIEALARQPADLTMLEAFRNATQDTFSSIGEEMFAFERQRVALIRSVPELRGALAREFERSVRMVADLTAERTGRSPDDIEVRAFAGALIGAAQAALLDRDPFDSETVTRVMDFLAEGMRFQPVTRGRPRPR